MFAGKSGKRVYGTVLAFCGGRRALWTGDQEINGTDVTSTMAISDSPTVHYCVERVRWFRDPKHGYRGP